jgi:glycosyltransferase involved in cell wall biosynthesis
MTRASRTGGVSAKGNGEMTNGSGLRSPPFKLFFVSPRYLPERGGTEIHTHEMAKRLSAGGADVTILTTSRERRLVGEEQEGSVRVRRMRAWPANQDYFFTPGLPAAIRAERPTLVHCQSYHTLVAPLAMLSALRARIPYVVTLHSGGHSSAFRRRIRPLQAFVLRPLFVRAAALVAVSVFEAELFAGRLRVPRGLFTVIPSGVELPAVPERGPPPTEPLILSIGRLELYKGHHRLIQALPALRQTRPALRLRLVGSGPLQPELRALAEQLGVGDALEIAPVAAGDRMELARLIQQAAAVVMLSDYESQGLSVQEALAMGKAVLVNDSTALGELVNHPNVRAVDRHAGAMAIADALLALLDTPLAPAPAMPSWDDCAAALGDLYEEALATWRGI